MKIIRFLDDSGNEGLASQGADGSCRRLTGTLFGALRETRQRVEPVRVLAPLRPTQIICIGLNYRAHAEETGAPIPEHPVVFMKNIGSVCSPGDSILLPSGDYSKEVDYECELAVVIGRDCVDVRRDDALQYVYGYTCGNDVSARDWQKSRSGGQWCRAKSFDTFCPLGPCLVTSDEIPDPNALSIQTRLNGEVVQQSSTSDMIFDVAELIAFLSRSATLPAGTVILTGTPPGVGMARTPPLWLRDGDQVEVEISGIGTLSNNVATAL